MKKMICEVCGESDFLKENGVFVCQTCGMKYSLAEAKKLVKEVSDTEQSVNYAENNPSDDDYSTKDLCDSGCANSSNNSVLDDEFDYEGFNEFTKIDYKNDFISKYSDSEIIKIASQTDFRDDSKDFAHVFYEMKKIDDNPPNSTGRVSIAQALPYFISLEKAHANLNENEYLDVKTLYFFLLSFTEIKEYNTHSMFLLTKIISQHFNVLAPIEKYMVNGDTETQEIIKGYDIYNSDDPRLKDIRPKKGFVNKSKNESSNSEINVSKSDENANSNTTIEDNEQHYINADDFINSYKIEEIIDIALHSNMIKMSDGLDALKVSQSIKNGSTGDLSIAQITCLIISLQDAKKNLSATEYRDVETLFLFLQSFKDKKNYDIFELEQTSKVIIQHFNVLAPYKYYSGNKDYSIAEALSYNWNLIDDSANHKRFTPYKGYTTDYLTKINNNQATNTFQPLNSNIESNKVRQSSKSNSFSILKLIFFIVVVLVVIISLQGLANSGNNENDNSNFGPTETVKSEENDNNYSNESQNKTVSIMIGTMHLQIPDGFRHIETDSDYLNYYYNEDHDQAIYYDVFHGSIDDIDESVFEQYCENEDGCPYDELTRSTLNQHYIVYTFMNDPSDGYTNAIYYVQLNSTDIAQVLFRYSDSDELNAKGIMNKARFN